MLTKRQREQRGSDNENRFRRLANKRVKATPDWFVRVQWPPAQQDVRGIDFIARVKRRWKFWDVMSVPVQVKSSEHFVAKYYETHPEAKKYGVIVLVVNDSRSDEEIRAELFRELQKARRLPRFHFKAFLDPRRTKPLKGRGEELRKGIIRQRQKKR